MRVAANHLQPVKFRRRRESRPRVGDVLVTTIIADGYRLRVWTSTNPAIAVSQDSWVVETGSSGLRVAAIDGVTPHPGGVYRLGLDSAAYAAQITRAALCTDQPASVCLEQAHRAVFDPDIALPRLRSQAGAACVDIDRSGKATATLAYDCEIWARIGDFWLAVGDGPTLTDQGRTRCAQLLDAHSWSSLDERIAREAEVLADPMLWRRTAVGQFPELRLWTGPIKCWDELVVSSDGARLTPERLSDLDDWLAHLRAWETAQPEDRGSKRHDDVTVVHIQRQYAD